MIPSGRARKTSSQRSAALLVAARAALKRGPFIYGSKKLEGEFFGLGLLEPKERLAAVERALAEIQPKHRTGPNSPGHISKEPLLKGRRMFAFAWDSSQFKQKMYLKFCLTDGDLLALFSFHESKPKA
jgi:hypothetical protein